MVYFFATVVLLAAAMFGVIVGKKMVPPWLLLAGIVAFPAFLIFTERPFLILIAIIIGAILVPISITTGTDVQINMTVLVIPAASVFWLLYLLVHRNKPIERHRTMLPLLLFLAFSFISLLIGIALWDPVVPRPSNLWLVQLAQWAIFALSGMVYILSANVLDDERSLRWLVYSFLLIAGLLAIVGIAVGIRPLILRPATIVVIRTPFWILLAGLAGGQLLFNRELNLGWRYLAIGSLIGTFVYAFFQERDAVSNWVGVLVVVATLIWLKWPRLRVPAVIIILFLGASGLLFPTLWEFGGGDIEWRGSGATRLLLAQRVLEVSMRNPISGLGPAAYRSYAAMTPLAYERAIYHIPSVNSHNNYIDIFSQTGIIGLGLFLWFLVEVTLTAWRLSRRYREGFAAGFANGMFATLVSTGVIMLLLDWFLPFVYNVGFPGFQASSLVWLFLGGLVALDRLHNVGDSSTD